MTYLPDIYKEFQQQFPDIAKAYDELALKCHSWGPLDEKTRRLAKLGIAILAGGSLFIIEETRKVLFPRLFSLGKWRPLEKATHEL